MSTPESRPLVEVWGVRDDERGHLWHGTHQGTPQQTRDWIEAHEGFAGTVVPLIAADRLTDEAVVEAVCLNRYGPVWLCQSEEAKHLLRLVVRQSLAALRSFLEGPDDQEEVPS